MITLSALCFLAIFGYGLYASKKEEKMRELKEWDRDNKKFTSKSHDSFELTEDQLVLTSTRDGETLHQNIFLFDEPDGVCFTVGGEFKVEIKMTRLNASTSLKKQYFNEAAQIKKQYFDEVKTNEQ